MVMMDEVRRLAQQGRAAEGIALVTRAAHGGDGEACLILANWRLWGVYGRRDLPECHALLERAAASGSLEARAMRANLLASGTGCAADPDAAREELRRLAVDDRAAAIQLELLEAMPSPQEARNRAREALSHDPAIAILRGLLTEDECRYLIDKAAPAMKPSMVVDPVSRRPKPDPVRTSSGMNFDPSQEDLVVNALNRRIAAATGTAYDCGEPLSILRYDPGEEYRPHVDALPRATNQRHRTALIWLNDGYAGGETAFIELGIEAKGTTGDCLVFDNADVDGRPDPRTRHAGRPVTAGSKWLASRWIRQRPYDPFTMT